MMYNDKRKGLHDRRIKICSSQFIPKSFDISKLNEALVDYNYEISKHGVYAPVYNFNGHRQLATYTIFFVKIDKDL